MSDLLTYRGYSGTVAYSNDDKVFHGRLAFIRALVTYEGTDVRGLEAAFQEAVDDYLELCEAQGKTPEQAFKGSFNVRTGSDLHRRAALYAQENGLNLNKVVIEALNKFLPV